MAKPWVHQNKLKRIDIPSYSKILRYVKEIEDKKVRALFSILYLTAARISEVVRRMEKKDIEIIEKDGKKIMLVTLFNEKNKQRKIKKIPINIEKEYPLVVAFLEYVDSIEDDVIFKFSRKHAFKLLRKYVGVNPHYIRHIRLTHLVTEFNFNEYELKIFAGWTDTRPAKSYIEMRWSDLIKKL